MSILKDSFGAIISTLVVNYSFWVVKLDGSDKLLSERTTVSDPLRSLMTAHQLEQVHPNWTEAQRDRLLKTGERPVDWALDLVSTGEIYKVKELHLICPPNPGHPTGQTARLQISIPGTAFQFKVGNVDTMGAWGRQRVAQVIGRLDDPATGVCTITAWDDVQRRMIPEYQTNIHEIQMWHESLAPVRNIGVPVLGLDRQL